MLGGLKERVARTSIGRRAYRMKRAWQRMADVVGTRGALLHVLLGPSRLAAWKHLRVRLDGLIFIQNGFCPAGVYMRAGSTDWRVFRQIFVEREYEPLCSRFSDVSLVVDLGANVGYSAVYFLERYRGAKVICVEPDERNFEVLLKNVARYGERVRCERAAIWSQDGVVELDDGGFVGKEWGVRVSAERRAQGRGVRAITMSTLLSSLEPAAMVDILKVDVEGAEKEILSDGCHDWLHRVRSMCIELHDGASEGQFHSLFDESGYEVFDSGELSVAIRRSVC